MIANYTFGIEIKSVRNDSKKFSLLTLLTSDFYLLTNVCRFTRFFRSASFKKSIYVLLVLALREFSNSYTMGCPPVRGDNPRALASGLSYVQVDKHGITILYHLHHCRPCTA